MKKSREKLNSAFVKHDKINIDEKKIITRSSCIFYFINNNQTSTELHFLNYWREKRGISDVRLKMTFRTMQGDIIACTEESIEEIGAYVKSTKTIFNALKIKESEGSVEMEFFSKKDMFISYPAVIVRYLGKDWHTSAHSSQRIYSSKSGDHEDLLNGNLLKAEEGNLVTSDIKSNPFFIMHNGPFEIPAHEIEFIITRENGDSISFTQNHISLKPYATILLKPKDIYNYTKFASGYRLSFTIKFITTGIFPRLISGFQRDHKWSIDHTNFADIQGIASKDTFKSNNEPNFKNLVFHFPIQPEWKNFADFPPTYPINETYKISMRKLGKKGESLEEKELFCGRKKTEEFSPRFEFLNETTPTNPEFVISNLKELPKRFHMVLNYQIGDGMPGFIVDGPLPFETKLSKTRWVPIFGNDCENYIIISNRVIGRNKPSKVVFKAKLFNSYNEKPLNSDIVVDLFENKIIKVKQIHKDAIDFLRNNHGWLYLQAEEFQGTNIHYASLLGNESIACDHGF